MAFIGKISQPAPEVPVVPNLEQRIEALLRVKLSRLKMPEDIKPLFTARTRNNIRKIAAAWSFWVGFLILINSAFDYYDVPRHLFVTDMACRLILFFSFAGAGLLIHRDIVVRLTPILIALPCLLTVACAGIVGLLSNDPDLLCRYHYEALIVVATALMFIGLQMKLDIILVALVLPMQSGFILASCITPFAAQLQTIFFDACTLTALIYGRHVQNLVLTRMFLLNMRDELRNVEANMRHEQLSSIAYTDPLTEIPNRRYFDEICASMSDTTKNLLPLSICMIDVDHFKLLNDKLGHLQGDRCLKLIAATIRANLRNPSDIVARFGGEEFVLLLPGTAMNAAYEVAERIRAAIMDLDHPNPGAPSGIITASIGVAELAKPPIILHPLLQNADHALYRAKISGRNRVST
jgi:diguanylate cyclase (GGDEF)-like protein